VLPEVVLAELLSVTEGQSLNALPDPADPQSVEEQILSAPIDSR
jgi:hypothetical protein